MSRWESGGCNMVVDNGLSVNGILKLVSNDRNYCHDMQVIETKLSTFETVTFVCSYPRHCKFYIGFKVY